jgi:ATP-dependent RNA helicase DeaD
MQSFQDLNLSPLLMKSITEMGFEKPTPIQAQTVPILLGEATDFLGLAATGTGKTVAFSIPLLEKIDPSKRCVQALILCPTRELALQVAGQIDLLGKHLGVRALPIYGGTSYGDQIRGLKNGATIVVGTPGRVVDHMEKGTLNLSNLEIVVLDEADEMISMGFKEDLENILSNSPREQSQIWFFCATMSAEVRKVANEYLREPQQVQVNRTEMVPEAIDQIYYKVHESDKPEIVCKLIDAADDFYGIIFCQTKALVTDLTQYLKGRDYRVDCLHGDMDQNARERTMQGFRGRRVTVLVCTDVASRGLDVKDITHVINYSIPRELDNYVHRIGRTARSGKTGFAMSLVTPSHRVLITRIEHMTKSKMREGRLPTRRDIGLKKVSNVLSKFLADQAFPRAIELMDDSWKTAVAEMSPEEITGRFLSLNFPEVFAEREEQDTRSQPPQNERRDSRYGAPQGRHSGPRPSGQVVVNNRPAQVRAHSGPAPKITPVKEAADAPLLRLEAPEAATAQAVAPKKKEWKHSDKKSKYGEGKPGDKKFADRKFGDRKFGDKKFGDKKYGDKKFERRDKPNFMKSDAGKSVGGGERPHKFDRAKPQWKA